MHVPGVGAEGHFGAGENVLSGLLAEDDSFGLCDSRVGKRTSLGVLRRSAGPKCVPEWHPHIRWNVSGLALASGWNGIIPKRGSSARLCLGAVG